MEPEGSKPNSQEFSTCLYPELGQSIPYYLILSLQDPSYIIQHLRLGLPSGLVLSGFPTNNLYAIFFSSIRATCFVHPFSSTLSFWL
jgi:hypothetical protein